MRLPKGTEVIGTITQALGACRFRADCKDGKTRMVRVPGRMKRRIFIKVGYVILMKPWDVEPEKADLVWSYKPAEARELHRMGLL